MNRYKNNLFPFSVVESAKCGDFETLQKIWKNYESYVNTLCGRPYQDAYGNVKFMIDQDMKDFIQQELYRAIIYNFDIDFVSK